MGTKVYANGNEIAAKASQGKVVAAFPDVCLSPPPPPAGPVPVPYPDSSFARDMRKGSKSVVICGQPVMLRDESFYKSSPLGNEAATRSFGGSTLSHTITGKTYFCSWSMDVTIERKNVPRHVDLATSNHASYPGSTPPFSNLQDQALARLAEGLCPCCGKAKHTLNWKVVQQKATNKPNTAGVRRKRSWFKRRGGVKDMNIDEWYDANITAKFSSDPVKMAAKKVEFASLMQRARARTHCSCPSPTALLPSPPCDVFFGPPPDKKIKLASEDSWDTFRPRYQKKHGIPSISAVMASLTAATGQTPTTEQVNRERKVNHLTPKSAGGCPTGERNLQKNGDLCSSCRDIDAKFSDFQ